MPEEQAGGGGGGVGAGRWVFGGVLLAILALAFFFGPQVVTPSQNAILRLFATVMAGILAFFMTGTISTGEGGAQVLEIFGKELKWPYGIKATGGLALAAIVWFTWPDAGPRSDTPVIHSVRAVEREDGNTNFIVEFTHDRLVGEQKLVVRIGPDETISTIWHDSRAIENRKLGSVLFRFTPPGGAKEGFLRLDVVDVNREIVVSSAAKKFIVVKEAKEDGG